MQKKRKIAHATASPISGDEVLNTFLHQQRPLRIDDALRVFGVARGEKKQLLELLDRLTSEGHLLRLHGGKWLHAKHARTVRGTLAVQRSGIGFVTPDNDSGLMADIFIGTNDMGDAWHGDRVELVLIPGTAPRRDTSRNAAGKTGKDHGRKQEGRILRVLERHLTELTAFTTRRQTPRGVLCRPSDARLNFELDVAVHSLASRPEPGTLLHVHVEDRAGEHTWNATALSAIGREHDAAVQERLVKINHRIPMEFPEGVENEASSLQKQRPNDEAPLEKGREDLRHIAFVTIDGADARDFDDAIHVEKTAQGWLLHVAIADVSWFVRPGSGLDREARERGNSCYFPLSVEPMLPEALSNDLCSLLPNKDRFVMVAALDISANGTVTASRFMPGSIRSRARLTYTAVQALFDGAADASPGENTVPQALHAMLHEAETLAHILRSARMDRGALDMDLPEPAYDVSADGKVLAIRKATTLFAHNLIEEFMLAANEAVARFLDAKGIPFPCRVHPEPDPVRLETLFKTLQGASLPPEFLALIPGKAKASGIKPLLDAARGTPQAFVVNRLVLRSMMQARYEGELAGHFGLASQAYCHFTSPIRRYADLIVHRTLRIALGHSAGPSPALQKLLAVADQCNVRERAAQEAEREITRRMACLLLADREGETFEGVLSGVMEFGIFVELADMPVEGMVRIATLDDDWYAYDSDRMELVGAGTGRTFRLGQPVVVRLVHADLGRLEIDLALLEGGGPGGSGGKRKITPRLKNAGKTPAPHISQNSSARRNASLKSKPRHTVRHRGK